MQDHWITDHKNLFEKVGKFFSETVITGASEEQYSDNHGMTLTVEKAFSSRLTKYAQMQPLHCHSVNHLRFMESFWQK